MLHKACGGLASTGALGGIAFVIAALEQAPSSTTTDWLWAGVGICLVVALVGTLGWLLTSESSKPVNVNIAGRDAYQAGRDINVSQQPESHLGLTENVKANVVFDGFEYVRDQRVRPANIGEDALSEFACLRFVNEPDVKGAAATVPDLHARIEISQSGNPILAVADGRWAENADREQAPGRETKSVPLPGNGETRTLNIVMQRRGEDDCYGWSHGGRQILHPPIPKGSYAVRVELDGSNMESRTFLFDLVNRGKDDFLELREAEGVSNPCSARSTKLRGEEAAGAETERVRRAIAAIDPLIGEAQAILDACGRPREHMVGADPMYFQEVCMPRINKFGRDADATIGQVAPEYIGKFQNVGNVTYGTEVKPAMIQQMERWLDNLGAIQDELRKRL